MAQLLKAQLRPFPRTYLFSDFAVGTSTTVVCQPTVYNLVGSLTVPAQQAVTFGANEISSGIVQGRTCQVKVADASNAEITGTWRFAIENATGTEIKIVAEEHSSKLNASATDRTLAYLLPEYVLKAGQDSKLRLYFKLDSATAKTIDGGQANTIARIPVTVYQ